MQTVNFNCPHCGNLMAVGTNLLGRNVRCPHCKQVVRAPAAAGEAPAVQGPAAAPQMPAFNIPGQPAEHHESIFGERHDEDLFGSEPLKPKLPSMPSAPPPPNSSLDETTHAPPLPAPQYSETQTYAASPAPQPAYLSAPSGQVSTPSPEEGAEPGPRRVYRPATAKTESPGTPAFAWILLAYSAVITIAAGIFAYQYFTSGSSAEHPFKAIPDFYGKYEKATGPENRKQLAYKGMPDPKMEVPSELRVKLGDEITVGSIQVNPTQVLQQAMEVTRENAVQNNVTSLAGTGLVLGLHVKNVSTDTTFHPDDPAFCRAFDKEQPLPYTALQIGRDFFYGPFAWPLDVGTKDVYLTGFKNPEEPLGPGQERDIWIAVAPKGMRTTGVTDAVSARQNAEEKQADRPFLWRVQLRRGFVPAKADDGKDFDVSATTVIGVEFSPSQIKSR
jgi:hypothetical protein